MQQEWPEEVRLRKRIKLFKVLRIVLDIPAVAFLVVAVFWLKQTGWIVAAASVTVVVVFVTNYIVLDAQNKLRALESEKKDRTNQ